MELGDAEAVGVEDDHHGRVGHVDADLDDGGGHEHVEVAARGTRAMTASFSAGGHPAVQQAEPQAGQLAGGRARSKVSSRRAHLELLALLDERAHDVGLAAGGDLVAHLLPTPPSRRSSPWAHRVTIGVRPGGSSSSTDTSRSP